VLTGHKNAVLQVNWFSPSNILSCSADKTVAIWDSNKGTRIRKFIEHTGIVNSCCAARDSEYLVGSGSDDCTAIIWDIRTKQSVSTVYHDYQICAVALSHDGQSLFTGGVDNIIR
jgi:Prp8 binding protein